MEPSALPLSALPIPPQPKNSPSEGSHSPGSSANSAGSSPSRALTPERRKNPSVDRIGGSLHRRGDSIVHGGYNVDDPSKTLYRMRSWQRLQAPPIVKPKEKEKTQFKIVNGDVQNPLREVSEKERGRLQKKLMAYRAKVTYELPTDNPRLKRLHDIYVFLATWDPKSESVPSLESRVLIWSKAATIEQTKVQAAVMFVLIAIKKAMKHGYEHFPPGQTIQTVTDLGKKLFVHTAAKKQLGHPKIANEWIKILLDDKFKKPLEDCALFISTLTKIKEPLAVILERLSRRQIEIVKKLKAKYGLEGKRTCFEQSEQALQIPHFSEIIQALDLNEHYSAFKATPSPFIAKLEELLFTSPGSLLVIDDSDNTLVSFAQYFLWCEVRCNSYLNLIEEVMVTDPDGNFLPLQYYIEKKPNLREFRKLNNDSNTLFEFTPCITEDARLEAREAFAIGDFDRAISICTNRMSNFVGKPRETLAPMMLSVCARCIKYLEDAGLEKPKSEELKATYAKLRKPPMRLYQLSFEIIKLAGLLENIPAESFPKKV